jgi:hypothetical protein
VAALGRQTEKAVAFIQSGLMQTALAAPSGQKSRKQAATPPRPNFDQHQPIAKRTPE